MRSAGADPGPGSAGALSCPAVLLQIEACAGLDIPRGLLRRHAAGKITGRLLLQDLGQLAVQPRQHGDAVQQLVKLRRIRLADRPLSAVRVSGPVCRQLRLQALEACRKRTVLRIGKAELEKRLRVVRIAALLAEAELDKT